LVVSDAMGEALVDDHEELEVLAFPIGGPAEEVLTFGSTTVSALSA